MSVLCQNVQIMCAKYYELGIRFKKLHLIKRVCLTRRQHLRYFRCPVWKTISW